MASKHEKAKTRKAETRRPDGRRRKHPPRVLRIAGRRVTHAELAEAAGLSIYSASRLISRDKKQHRSTTLARARKIARKLGVTLDQLADALEPR